MAITKPALGSADWGNVLNAALDTLDTRLTPAETALAGRLSDVSLSATIAAQAAPILFHVGAATNVAATDKAAINAKIAAANAAGGGIVQLRPGTYVIDGALTALANGVELRGHGAYTTVIRTTSATADVIISAGTFLVGVRDLQIESLVTRTAGSGIAFTNVEGFIVDNVRFIDPYNCGTFTTCLSGWLSRIKVAHGTATLNRGFWFQSCIDIHCADWLINGGNVALGAGKAWIQVDSGCDTFEMRGVTALASSGTGIPLRLSHTLGGASFAPRWLKFVNCLFEGSYGAVSGADGIVIEDCLSAYFTNCYVTTCSTGVNITGGEDIRFAQTIFLNNWLYGVLCNSVSAPKGLTLTDCTFSDNSAGGNGAATHLYLASGATITRVTGCSFSNDTIGNANKVSYAIHNDAPSGSVHVRDCYFDATAYATGILTGSVTPLMRDNQGYNPRGVLGPPAMPATGVAYAHTYGVDATVHITGGTVTAIAIGGTATGLTSGSFRVPAGMPISLAYSAAPTWTWFGD